MDLWQYNHIRLVKRRIDDLTSVIFVFIAYELGGIFTAFFVLLLDLSLRIYKFSKRKSKKIRVNSSAPGEVGSYSQAGNL